MCLRRLGQELDGAVGHYEIASTGMEGVEAQVNMISGIDCYGARAAQWGILKRSEYNLHVIWVAPPATVDTRSNEE